MFPPANRVKLDEETVELLTAAINSACSRQFDRFRAGMSGQSSVRFKNETLRPAPRPPGTASGSGKGKSGSANQIKRSDKKKPRLETTTPAVSSSYSDDSADSVGDLQNQVDVVGLDLDERGVMRE